MAIPNPSWTPWGAADFVEPLARGISWVGTPRHGGLRIAKGFAKRHLSSAAIKRAEEFANYLWYEEDVAWMIPMWELPQFWPKAFMHMRDYNTFQSRYDYLWQGLSRWFPQYLLAKGDQPIPELYEQWKTEQRDREMRREKHKDLIVSALRTSDPEIVQVWTADGASHFITSESYSRRVPGELNLLSKMQIVSPPVPKGVGKGGFVYNPLNQRETDKLIQQMKNILNTIESLLGREYSPGITKEIYMKLGDVSRTLATVRNFTETEATWEQLSELGGIHRKWDKLYSGITNKAVGAGHHMNNPLNFKEMKRLHEESKKQIKEAEDYIKQGSPLIGHTKAEAAFAWYSLLFGEDLNFADPRYILTEAGKKFYEEAFRMYQRAANLTLSTRDDIEKHGYKSGYIKNPSVDWEALYLGVMKKGRRTRDVRTVGDIIRDRAPDNPLKRAIFGGDLSIPLLTQIMTDEATRYKFWDALAMWINSARGAAGWPGKRDNEILAATAEWYIAEGAGMPKMRVPKRKKTAGVPIAEELSDLEDILMEGVRKIQCPHCGEIYRMEPDADGIMTCHQCGEEFRMIAPI